MLDASSGDTLVACHNAKSYAYDLFLHTAQAGEAVWLAHLNTARVFTLLAILPGTLHCLQYRQGLYTACNTARVFTLLAILPACTRLQSAPCLKHSVLCFMNFWWA